MADKPFVVNDRRKFTAEGELRPDAPPSEPKPLRPEQVESSARLVDTPAAPADSTPKGPQAVPSPTEAAQQSGEEEMPPPPTAEQTQQASQAYTATVDRLDTVIRAANPGAEQMPEMTFDRFIQSLYMQAIIQLGGGTQQGQQPQVDILGARHSIDMLAIIAEKTKGNLTEAESTLIESALFEMRMAFLEVTQALARQAAARQPGAGAPAAPGAPTGPSIVR